VRAASDAELPELTGGPLVVVDHVVQFEHVDLARVVAR
jgi:hypothetical protein